MSKKLKSFHKLFFIIIFSTIFSGIIGSGSSPDLPEKIAPELEQIEALPRRTKPAELNIEVTKIKSEPLEDVYIDRKNKNIYVDFSKKREQTLRGVKDAEELEKKYNLVVSETVQGTNEVNGRKKSSRNTSSVMDYEVVEYQGKKVLKIPYENEPEKIYISVQENGSEKTVKVYKINMENIQMVDKKGALIEEKVVIVNLQSGIENWKNAKFVFNLDGTLTYNLTGAAGDKTENIDSNKVQIIKSAGFNSTNDGFINSFRQNVDIKVTSLGAKDPNPKILYKGDQNSSEAQFYYVQKPENTGNGQDGIEIKYLTDGNLTFRFQQIDSIGKVTYTINIEHIEKDTENIKKHTLIINAIVENNPIERSEVTLKYKNGYTYNWYKFNENGIIIENNDNNLNIYKADKFLTTIPFRPETQPTVKVIDLSSEKNEVVLNKFGWYIQSTLNFENGMRITPQFISDGNFEFNMGTTTGNFLIGPKYKVKLEHRNSSGILIKEQILNIDTEEIKETLQLKLLSGFNKNTPIVFNETGIAISNATLTSDTKRYLKSLDIKSNYNYINNGEVFEIDSLGSSKNFNIVLSEKYDSAKKLELNVEYKNKYPTLKILNEVQAGTYILNINHNNNENEKKLNYVMEIIVEETKKLMKITTNLKDIVIDDVENLVLNYDFGNLEMEQVGNGDYIVNKNPFPAIALGNQKESNGWEFSNNINNIPVRDDVLTDYKADNNSDNLIKMKMYLGNTVGIITNEGGGTPTILNRGKTNNVIGVFGNSKREKITTKLKGEISIDKFISNFRNSKDRQIVLKPQSNSNEQISFIIGQAIGNNDFRYDVPLTNNLVSGVVDKKIDYANYPNIIVNKPLLEENLTLNIKNTFDLNNSIQFTPSGVNVANVELISDKKRYLKALYYDSLFTLGKLSQEFKNIINGNTNVETIILYDENDSNKTLILEITYKDRYPILKIKNYPKVGNYKLKIKHYDSSKLDRLDYNLNIIIDKDFILPEPSMVKTNNLKDIIIEDDVITEKYKILNDEFGTLTMEQTKLVSIGDMFPVITLGNQFGGNGWEFISTTANKIRGSVVSIFKNNLFNQYPIDVKMSLLKVENESVVPIGATEIKIGNLTSIPESLSGFGAFKTNALEKITLKLKGEIQNKDNLSEIISNFRENPEREIKLLSQDVVSNQISYVIGEQKNGNYIVPATSQVSTADTKVENIGYPNVKIIKPILKDKVIIDLANTFDFSKPIQLKENSITLNGVTIKSEQNRFLKSLHYNSFFNINDAGKKNIESNSTNSQSDDYDITLSNEKDVIVIRVKYINSRFPEFRILGEPKAGTYTMLMKHFDPSGLERLNYTIDINIEDKLSKEFEVTSSMKDILILPDKTVEIPNNWIKVVQLVNDKDKFPVIGLNKPKWEIQTDTPLNPIDKRPMAALKLGDEILKVPVNIRETPYQNTQKFFVYNRGDMTNRNIAVGAYTPYNSEISRINNKVEIDFQMFFEEEHIEKIVAYAAEQEGENITIPYDDLVEDNTIYAIKGLLKNTSKVFTVSKENVLLDGIIKFPKIVVSKNYNPIEKKATLNFINPIPKSAGDISGSFDIIYGSIAPNNLQNFSHPNSLTVNGITLDWHGFTLIPEHHKVQIKVGDKKVKEFTTTETGEIKGTQIITNENNEYILMKGQNASLAIGINKWDFNAKKDIIVFEHINSNGRVVARDKYEINLPTFSLIKYLDATNSSLIANRGSNKDLAVTANARQDFIELGTLKLQNYQKDITKVGNYNEDTKLYENEVRIETISTDLTLESLDKTQLKGTLKFDSNKSSVSMPNESATLRFVLSKESTANINNIIGKTFTITTSNVSPLIKIKGGNNQLESLLEKLTITLKDGQVGKLPNMSFVSTVTALTIKENDLGTTNKLLQMPGRMTLRQLDGGQGNSVPAIALGLIEEWRVYKGNRHNTINNRTLLEAQYTIGNSNEIVKLRPELTSPSESVDDIIGTDGVKITNDQIKLYLEKYNNKILTALTYVARRNTRTERITTGLALEIPSSELPIIKKAIRSIAGDRIELKATGNNAKIAYIHAKDKGNTGSEVGTDTLYIPTADPILANSYAYETLPSIFIEKENLYKNLEITFLPTYNSQEIVFTDKIINQPIGGVTEILPKDDFRVLEGLDYKHKIRLTLPGGQIKEYITSDNGGTIDDIVETLEKNGKMVKVHLKYLNDKEIQIWVTDRKGSQYYDLVLQHVDPSGDVRRTTNIRIVSQVKDNDAEFGELDFVISSRYNAFSGQLNSKPLLITSKGIDYQSEVLDLNLLSGNYPVHPGMDKEIFISYSDSTGPKEIKLVSELEIETSKMKLKFKKDQNTGNISIKPLNWSWNSKDEFILMYKKNDNIENQYKFNVKCPEFFVASTGVLDFGKIYKTGNPEDKIKETNIELYYNDSTINPTYSLDISTASPDPNTLYLDDEIPSRLKVVNLNLKEDKIRKEILNDGKGQKVILPLEGTIPKESIKTAKPGKYEKTVQILIHIK